MQLDKKVLLLVALFCVQGQGHYVPKLRTFNVERNYTNMRILQSSSPDVVTENESFLYASCNTQENTFKQNECDVVVETPAFENATYLDICKVKIEPKNSKLETLTKLTLQPFGDDKVLLTWAVKDHDWHTKDLRIRVLHMSDCRYRDVSILADKLHKVVPYESSFDVVVRGFNKALCGSDHCKFTFNIEGDKINGPSQFLAGVKFTQLDVLIPAMPRSPLKGFYALLQTGNGTDDDVVMQASNDGKSSEIVKPIHSDSVKLSNAHELLGICWTSEHTNVTCKQYDAKMSVKFITVLEFPFDAASGTKRWIRPHNLLGGGMILVTGLSYGKDNRRFNNFSLIKIQGNGQRERPLRIQDSLDFECLNTEELRVAVSENDDEEFCIHFHCERSEFAHGVTNILKYGSQCLPKKYASMVKHQAAVLN